MASASRELLAAREHVWGFLAEPNHLPDWWPGVVGVVSDRRGLAEGARWNVARREGGLARLPTGGRAGRVFHDTLLVTALQPLELWSWQLVGRRGLGVVHPIEVEVRLRSAGPDRTTVTVTVTSRAWSRWASSDAQTARRAADRLYELVQTTATL